MINIIDLIKQQPNVADDFKNADIIRVGDTDTKISVECAMQILGCVIDNGDEEKYGVRMNESTCEYETFDIDYIEPSVSDLIGQKMEADWDADRCERLCEEANDANA